MNFIDFTAIILYFLGVGLIGYFSSKKSLKDSKSYFLAGNEIGFLAIGASLFASNISAEHFIGLAGSGYKSGLAVGQFELLACFILLILGWLFVPFYIKTGVFTMPEFLEKRFSKESRMYLSAISLIAYVFTKVSVAIYAGAVVLQTILGINIWLGAIILILATGLYTIFGGLRAVIYTDFFQAFILIGGAILLTFISINKLGGISVLLTKVNPDFFSLWKGIHHPDFPWTGILFGAPILGIWYWCTDQMIVQRTLAAKNINEARKATILAGFLKILPVFILVLPGIAGLLLYPNIAPDKVYATLVNNLLPPGIKGLVVAGLLAALMSSLSSVFNSSSTLVVIDFYKKFKPLASEKELVKAGQIATIFLVIIGLLWLPFIGIINNQLYVYLQSVQAYISPPIAAVFLLGITWKRLNATGAFTSLITGFILGASRFILEILYKTNLLHYKPLQFYASMNFLHFAIFLFIVSVLILVIVSLLTPPPDKEKIDFIFKKEMTKEDKNKVITFKEMKEYIQEKFDNYNNIVLSIVLSSLVLIIWVIFSPLFFK